MSSQNFGQMVRIVLLACFCSMFLILAASCLGETNEEGALTGQRVVRVIPIEFEQEVVIPSSVLKFGLRGTERLVAGRASVRLKGTSDSLDEVNHVFEVDAERESAVGELFVRLDASQIWPVFNPSPRTGFRGSIEIEFSDEIGLFGRGSLSDMELVFESEYLPMVETIQMGAQFANHSIDVQGLNFLRPEEGTTWAVVEKGFVQPSNGQMRSIVGQKLPIRWTGSRTRAALWLDPGVFGVQIAEFELDVRFENELRTQSVFEGNRQDGLKGRIEQSYIAALSSTRGSRGQKVGIVGRGFVPMSNDAGYGMLLRYDGILTPTDSSSPTLYLTGNDALERIADRVEREDRAEMSVWFDIDDRTLRGFGAMPGVFRGTITPILFDAFGEQRGIGWEGEFTITPTLQVVYLKYLPSFSKGLEKYGLENVERDIRDRILEVVRRDYEGVNIRFAEREPDDFIEFSTIELGGPDPSGNAAFGYDNTYNQGAKDTGNLHLSDYLGGLNAQSGSEYNNPYGGIFIESFSVFSAKLNPKSKYASPHFDSILKHFMPKLGGKAVRATEWPDGPRSGEIRDAVLMVGNVIGNTVSHEIGHSLGMTFDPRDWETPMNIFHNVVAQGCIMDSGEDRSFEQRAELNDEGPASFSALNRQYLNIILPVQP